MQGGPEEGIAAAAAAAAAAEGNRRGLHGARPIRPFGSSPSNRARFTNAIRRSSAGGRLLVRIRLGPHHLVYMLTPPDII